MVNQDSEHESDGTRVQRSKSPVLRGRPGESEWVGEGPDGVKKLVGWNELLPLPYLHKHFSMICLIWNCRGAGNSVFRRTMADLLRNHNPDFLVLVETKVPFATLNEFFKSKGFTASSYSGPVG